MKDKNTPPPDDSPKKPRRVVRRVAPFSPWQIMMRDRGAELRISTRALAQKIATPRRTYEHTTIWSWLRSPEGTPPGDTYTPELNRNLAIALAIKPDVLAAAFEESRRKFILSSTKPGQQGPLNVLRTLFANARRKTWKTSEIVKLIDELRGL